MNKPECWPSPRTPFLRLSAFVSGVLFCGSPRPRKRLCGSPRTVSIHWNNNSVVYDQDRELTCDLFPITRTASNMSRWNGSSRWQPMLHLIEARVPCSNEENIHWKPVITSFCMYLRHILLRLLPVEISYHYNTRVSLRHVVWHRLKGGVVRRHIQGSVRRHHLKGGFVWHHLKGGVGRRHI